VPEKQTVLSLTAPGFSGGSANTGFVRASLVPPGERVRSQKEIVAMINRNLFKYTEGRAVAIEDQTIQQNRRGGQPVQFVLTKQQF
jgi:multidrug efflux pump subunit AcrB